MTTTPATQREMVVLVHGLWLKGWCMTLLAWRLRCAGFDTLCFSYPTLHAGLRESATRLQATLSSLPHPTLHLVGHSLGCIVIRSLFHHFPQSRPGRVVMLAPPNRGSAAAQRLARGRLGRALLGQGTMDLLSGATRDWSPPAREIGIVSGTRGFGLARLVVKLPTPNDGVVTVAETTLSGIHAQVLLPVAHSRLLISPTVGAAVSSFLRKGRFA